MPPSGMSTPSTVWPPEWSHLKEVDTLVLLKKPFRVQGIELEFHLLPTEGRTKSTKDVTAFLNKFNQQRIDAQFDTLTFDVFSGYQSGPDLAGTKAATENVAVLKTETVDEADPTVLLNLYIDALYTEFHPPLIIMRTPLPHLVIAYLEAQDEVPPNPVTTK